MKCQICLYNKTEETELFKLKCQHSFCWICLNYYLKKHLNKKIKCPVLLCDKFIRDNEIRRVLSDDDIALYEKKCIEGLKKTHKCLLEQCDYYIIYTDNDIQYQCEICQLYNCISCKASHSFMSCEVYQLKTEKEKEEINEAELKIAQEILVQQKAKENREIMIKYHETDLLNNTEVFNCNICSSDVGKNDGIMLINCFDKFCKDCILEHIKTSSLPIKCPNCDSKINDREIQKILPEKDLQQYHDRCADLSKINLVNHIQCQTPDCNTLYDNCGSSDQFECRNCKVVNCLKCKAIHTNESCQQYSESIKNDVTMKRIQEKINAGEYMKCLKCETLLKKIKGCNWIQCTSCFVELCWIRKMLRWGPEGRDDTSGGCRCNVDDKPCHELCNLTCTPHSRNIALDDRRNNARRHRDDYSFYNHYNPYFYDLNLYDSDSY